MHTVKGQMKQGGHYHEACKDFEYTDPEQHSEKGWLRRVSDILPVCM